MPNTSSNAISLNTIGSVYSPYKEKFAVPRQPGLVPSAKGRIELLSPFDSSDAVRDLLQFSHIWVLFIFHGTQQQGWKPLVKPPRLGGNNKTGVFSTRSTFRPNPVGMAVVQLDDIAEEGGRLYLEISGLDLLDQTPVIDIKPYLPYSDSLPHAQAGFATEKPAASMQVVFSSESEHSLQQGIKKYPQLRDFICEVLSQDPRPAYKRSSDALQSYGVRLYDFNIAWEVAGNVSRVMHITNVSKP